MFLARAGLGTARPFSCFYALPNYGTNLIWFWIFFHGGAQGDSDRTRGRGCRLKYRRCPLNIWRHFSTMRVTEPWQRLPREAGDSPASEILKSRLDMLLSNGIQLIMLEQGLWMAWPAESPFNLSHCVILSL